MSVYTNRQYFFDTVRCKFSWRPWRVRLSPWRWSLQTPLTMSSKRSRIRRESHLISRDWSLPVSSWRMAELCLTTTFKRSQLFTWSWDWEEVSLSHPLRLWLPSTTVTRLFVESATPDCHQELTTAERESAVTATSWDQRRSLNEEFIFSIVAVAFEPIFWIIRVLILLLMTFLKWVPFSFFEDSVSVYESHVRVLCLTWIHHAIIRFSWCSCVVRFFDKVI